MSSTESVVSAQLKNLLETVNVHRDNSCKKIRDTAHQQAGEIVRKAYRDARNRVHRNIQENRQQVERSIASARAQHETRVRLRKQQMDRKFLDQAWQQIHDALQSRWQSVENRNLWIDMILQQAHQVLLNKSWHIDYPSSFGQEEKSRLMARVEEYTGNAPEMQPSEDITAGLRIFASGACVDGSIAGLLADRSRIDSELLALGTKAIAT